MPKFLVKCPVCTWASEAGTEECPVCHAILPALPKNAPAELPTSFAEKYAAETAPETVVVGGIAPARSWRLPALVAGIVLVLVAAIGGIYMLGPGSAQPTPPRMVYGPPTTPKPTPTPAAAVAGLVAQLNDPGFSVHVTATTSYTADAKIMPNGKGVVVRGGLDMQVSNGDEAGTISLRGGSTEFRLVDGTYYQRTGNKWKANSLPLATLPASPLFEIHETSQLTLVGEESLDGATATHMRTTRLWSPDLHRVSLIDTFHAQPQSVVMDIWATPDGTPIRAILHVFADAESGAHLMTIETRYDFRDAGIPVEIVAPA